MSPTHSLSAFKSSGSSSPLEELYRRKVEELMAAQQPGEDRDSRYLQGNPGNCIPHHHILVPLRTMHW